MPSFYVDTGGASTNSGSRDTNAALASGSNASLAGSTFTLDGSPDLSSLVTTAGLTQDTIYIANATNANRRIFPITSFDNSAKTVTVSGSPTVSGNGAWAIGGRVTLAGLTGNEAALQAGDEVIVNNSPAASASTLLTFRTNGSLSAGFIKLKGKTGVRPVFNCTSTPNAIDVNNSDMIWIENIEVDQDGASGNAINNIGQGSVLFNVKIVDAGNDGIDINEDGVRIIGCEISGCGGDAIDSANLAFIQIVGCYIHDNTGNGWNSGATITRSVLIDNIFDTNGGSGINLSGAPSALNSCLVIYGNTFYGNGAHGITASDGDHSALLMNNLFLDNGNTGSEYNLNWPISFHLSNFGNWNIFSQNGGAGGTNLNNYTAQSNDLTSNPDINTSTFLPNSGSPAKAAGFPGAIPPTGTAAVTGYRDIGAMQRQEAGSGGGLITHPGMGGGLL